MKRIIKLIMLFGLVGALTLFAHEVKPGKVELIDLGKGVKLEMVLVPAGKFMMGVSWNAAIGFEDCLQTKKAPGLITQTGGSIIFNRTYLRLFLISSSTVEI